ncbi:MAG: hypothetical protein M1448_00590 [Candidatus Marsarchaeota archaeon]|jgi:hypothetical protein|nr:hypothetical protein [Candidatus Marsarchaeota archaeon]
MARITYSPLQDVVVHEIVEVKLPDLLRERITPSGNMPLYWCDGIAFSFSSLPMTEEVVKEYMRGVLHWAEVHYSEMKTYREVEELIDEHYPGPMKVRIIDTSRSPLHSEFVKWVKKMKKQK